VFTKARQVNPIQVLTNQTPALPTNHTLSQSNTRPPNQAHALPIKHTLSQSSTRPPNQAHTLLCYFLHIHFNILQPRMKLCHLHGEGSDR
jgi:hypothetical protein